MPIALCDFDVRGVRIHRGERTLSCHIQLTFCFVDRFQSVGPTEAPMQTGGVLQFSAAEVVTIKSCVRSLMSGTPDEQLASLKHITSLVQVCFVVPLVAGRS